MTTTRSIRDEVQNVLDYLVDAELVRYANGISMGARRVTWHAHNPAAEFMTTRLHANLEQYLHWVTNGIYSAILRDGSLLQITYEIANGRITGHRLAYIPCPFLLDESLLDEGEPLADVVSLYGDIRDVALRSPVRFDYDFAAAGPGHPAAHMTINSVDCRIACIAPMHVLRFVDFIYQHFYPQYWRAHAPFFAEAVWRHVGQLEIVDSDRRMLHLAWDVHATAAG
ncbi:DUF2290 domain-containing protein [Longispora sp. NPDC051575]|uniref:DUF2290 domain-containing protein n=1 Tax=Longispora sp. NPDC051575 TaxID=3154943 RepID=UPI003438FC74